MSLINQMLRDLDRRRDTEGSKRPAVQAVGNRRASRTGPAVALTALVCIGLGAAAWWWFAAMPQTPVVTQAAVRPQPAQATRPDPAAPAPAARVSGESETVSVTEPDGTADSLPQPPDVGAESTVPEPASGEALVRVETRPARNPATPASGAAAVPGPVAEESPATPAPADTAADTQATEPASNAAPEGDTTEPLVVKRPAQRTPEERFRQGVQAAARGNWDEAAARFAAALEEKPDMHGARSALADALLRTGRTSAAVRVLQQGLARAPGHLPFRKQYASLQLAAGQPAAALATLDAGPVPAVAAEPEWHALRAGLLQQTGALEAAAEAYRRLIEYDAGRGVWWAGLAISLDQLGAPAEALTAYRRAIQAGGLPPSLLAYANRRIEALQ